MTAAAITKLRIFLFASFFLLLSAFCFFDFLYPDLQWKRGKRLSKAALQLSPEFDACSKTDSPNATCVERLLAKQDTIIAQQNDIWLPVKEAEQLPDFREALQHQDGSPCPYIGTISPQAAVDSELQGWLKVFGEKRYLDVGFAFLHLNDFIERNEHPPHPYEVIRKTMAELKEQYFPFTRSWRLYSYASYFFKRSPYFIYPLMPAPLVSELLPHAKAHPNYFWPKNLMRLLDLSKVELTRQRLNAVAHALQQYHSTTGRWPVAEDQVTIDFSPLIEGSFLSLHDVEPEDKLNDWWGCPLEGKWEEKALILTSRGGDCTSGGADIDADIALSIPL